ncbi:hypothetical protein DFQ26_001946, partial [Actinomortierella ambigua]
PQDSGATEARAHKSLCCVEIVGGDEALGVVARSDGEGESSVPNASLKSSHDMYGDFLLANDQKVN